MPPTLAGNLLCCSASGESSKDSVLLVTKRRSFHDKTDKFICGKSRGRLKEIGAAGKLVDEAHQGMIIP
jgi:hypothetical protein